MGMSAQERGRGADRPGEIPKEGWLDIAWRTMKEFSDDRVLLVAAGVTFYLLLALAPTIAAFVSIYGLFFDPATIQEHVRALSGIVPGGGMAIIEDQLETVAGADQASLGLAFALSLVLALWSANAGMKALFEAMNVAYDEEEKRGFVALTLATMTMTVLTLASIIGLIAANLAFTTFASAIGLDRLPDWIVTTVTAVVALAALIAFMAALYRFGPSREKPRWAWITPGAVIAGLGVVLVSVAFSFYVANFGTYNETYGSLGAVIGFLTWLWLTMTVLILGGEINSEMEHQTGQDTTTGADRPMGARGAVMADNVGAAYGAGDPNEAGGASEGGEAADRRRVSGPGGPVTGGRLAVLLGAVGLRALLRDRGDGRR